MSFWKNKGGDDGKGKLPAIAAVGQVASPVAADLLKPETVTAPLAVTELRRGVDESSLGFRTTAELEAYTGLIGQDRALKAIQFGANIRAYDFNIFVLGPPASGKTTAVRTYLARKSKDAPPPSDWIYVNNFEDPNRPKAMALPMGRATRLAKGMVAAVDELRTTVPRMFEGEEATARRNTIEEEFRAAQAGAFEALNAKAQAQDIAIIRTPTGVAMAPLHEGKVVKPEVFNALPETVRKEVEGRMEALQKELEGVLEQVPKWDKRRRQLLRELSEELARIAVRAAIDDVQSEFKDVPAVLEYLEHVSADMIRNVALFLSDGEAEEGVIKGPVDSSRDARYRRYMVNVMVSNGAGGHAGAPLVEEMHPIYGNMLGRVEHIAQMGALLTDFLLIKPGALHRANGGYLMIDARKLLQDPLCYEALKRALKTREIRIESRLEAIGLASTQSLEPDPIPLDVKVVLLGEAEIYHILTNLDPDFRHLFKVQADFDDTIFRSAENDRAFAAVIASIVQSNKLRPVDAGGVARIIEEAARLAGDREKLSIELGRISDIVREADYWAGEAGHPTIGRADVARCVEERTQRADRMRDRSQEMIRRSVQLVDTEGFKVGQINGLSVLALGSFAFGRPSRISASVRLGPGRITDIEREVDLGGPLHSKGVMILGGFLAGRFAHDKPLAIGASLVFEQSYGGVDGDSASSAELYALLSALSGIPIDQGLAVTGSVNQMGEVQAIGGANEKIEGFFDVCHERGLNGRQGVLIPRSNVQHLMLREDVLVAVRAGQFHVYPVTTIDQGMEILTGVRAGSRGPDGKYPDGTINARVEARLREFAERGRAFAKGDDRSDGGKAIS